MWGYIHNVYDDGFVLTDNASQVSSSDHQAAWNQRTIEVSIACCAHIFTLSLRYRAILMKYLHN